MNSLIFKTLLNYNLDVGLPRGIHKEHLIHAIHKKTGEDQLTISRKLDILFQLKNKSARKQMLFTLFLILSDSKIDSLLNMNYKQSIPNDDQLDQIINGGIKYLSNIKPECVKTGLSLVFNPSYAFTPKDDKTLQIEDVLPLIEFNILMD